MRFDISTVYQLAVAARKAKAASEMHQRARFESGFIRVPIAGCWLWTGWLTAKGYGLFSINGVQERAHRAAWMIYRGPIPDGALVCHHCDVASCVNPDHLFLGSAADNTRDAIRKGRLAIGERSGVSICTRDQVAEIRRLHVAGRSRKDIASLFSMTYANVGAIIRRASWKHIT